jgi:hypothetical protein
METASSAARSAAPCLFDIRREPPRGEFTFTYGKGAFRVFTGKTPFVGGINIERKEEGRIYAYAHWPKLTYQVP